MMATGPQMQFSPGSGTQPDPSGSGLQMPAPGQVSQTPGSASDATQTQVGSNAPTPTKFGMLMKVLAPAISGGIIGWAGGKGTPGGGFQAANQYFMQQRQLQMQRAVLSRQMNNDQFRNMLEFARTQHTISQPNFNGRGTQPVAAKDLQVSRESRSG